MDMTAAEILSSILMIAGPILVLAAGNNKPLATVLAKFRKQPDHE